MGGTETARAATGQSSLARQTSSSSQSGRKAQSFRSAPS